MTAVYIIADIEGSTGCLKREDAQLFNDGWVRACVEMSRDIDLIGRKLLSSGIRRVRVKDFHRSGFNLFRELIDEGIELDQGYEIGPVTGLGDATGFDFLLMTGMHAASGTEGFLPHTLTSRFSSVTVNGRLLTEAELFAASVAPCGLIPAFFSGCPTACNQAGDAIKNIRTFAVEKPLSQNPETVRHNIANAALSSLSRIYEKPYVPSGPFSVNLKMRDGSKAAAKLRKTWKMAGDADELNFACDNIHTLYWQMIRLAYLTPFVEAHLLSSLMFANMGGRLAHRWARFRAKRLGLFKKAGQLS